MRVESPKTAAAIAGACSVSCASRASRASHASREGASTIGRAGDCSALRAAGAGERDGVYSCTANAAADPLAAEETRWANAIQNELKAEFAAGEFKRGGEAAPDSNAATFYDFTHGVLQVPALTLKIPYAMVGSSVLTQKDYREIGRRLMEAIVRRRS